MSRRSFLFAIGIVLLLGSIGTVFVLLLSHEPAIYARTTPPPGDERKHLSGEFQSKLFELYTQIHDKFPPTWEARFSETGINSYFEEGFVLSNLAEKILPDGVSAPRIAIDPDKIRLAFRYRVGPLNTIISIDMRVWLATKREPNVIGLELQGLHAGSVPIAAQSLLEQISETARQNGIEVIWYRHNGNPVALLRFQADQPHPTIQFTKLQLHSGQIYLEGRSIDINSARAFFPADLQPEIKPLAAN
jgi:hypothetical protein